MEQKRRLPRIALAGLLVVALLLAALCPLLSLPVKAANSDLLQNFDAWTDTTGLALSQNPITGELAENSGHGKSLKLTVPTPAVAGAGDVGFATTKTDWRAGTGLQVYVKNLSAENALAVRFSFLETYAEGVQEQWVVQHDKALALVTGETVTEAKSVYGFTVLPAGFEGYVRIPFSSFGAGWDPSHTAPALQNAYAVYASFDTNGYAGLSMLLDDVSLITPSAVPVAEDFNAWYDTSRIAADGDPVAFALVNDAVRGNMLKVTITGTDTNPTGGANVGFNPTKTDWSGRAGLQTYIKNLSDKPLALRIMFIADGELWATANGAKINLIAGDVVTQVDSANGGFITLPANFEGFIQQPFTAFAGQWGTGKALNLAAIVAMYASFDTVNYRGQSVLLDDFTLVDTIAEPTPELPPVTPPEDTDMTIQNFDAWTDASGAQNDQDPIAIALEDGALKLTVTGTDTNPVGTGNVGFNPTKTDWSDGTAIQLYMKNLSDKPLAVRLMFIAGNGTAPELWAPQGNTKYNLVVGDKVTEAELTYGFIKLPSSFEGYVQLPFADFSGLWYGAANPDAEPDLSSVNAVYASFDTSEAAGYRGQSMLLDEITLLEGLDEPTEETEPEKPENKPTVIVEDFGSWTDASGAQNDQDPIAIALENGALKLTVTGTDTNPVGTGNVGFNPTVTDWSGKTHLQAYMKNLSDKPLAVRLMFIAGNGTEPELWTTQSQTKYSLIADGKVTEAELVYGFIMLPAGFDGYVELPFADFSGAWHGPANPDARPDLSTITSVYVSFDTRAEAGYRGQSMLLDNIAVTSEPGSPATGVGVPVISFALLVSGMAMLAVLCRKHRKQRKQ